ncbi:CheR family methyltransferase [Aestuariivirga sp.]|uniref:CheR family methyltransferase n=1 Tax=Aestuariivirga sp. TaxID=2650926 RepID=UPI003BAD9343
MTSESRFLTGPELVRLCDFLYRRTGMLFGESKRYYVDRRVAERVQATGALTFSAYFPRLLADHAESELLINSFTVNETYFYREEHQLRCLSQSLLPEIIKSKRPGDRIRIWSVPCSTGEEPYSIAIWLLENWRLVDAYHVEIVGSDIDTEALRRAQAGAFDQRSLSRLSDRLRDSYFQQADARQWHIIDDLRQSVKFSSVNLIDRSSVAAEGQFDVIFCRNVLIYFDDAARSLAAGHLHDAMLPGGYVCLGHTESMGRISVRFKTAQFEDAVVYQRSSDQ